MLYVCKSTKKQLCNCDCTDKLFTSTLTGAAGVLAIFLLLLVFLLYKYKQVSFIILKSLPVNALYNFIDVQSEETQI